jgi:hypothetical protein
LLIGDYVTADPDAIVADLERYACGCIVRHFYYDTPPLFLLPDDEGLVGLIGRAYETCRSGEGPFEDNFAAKCQTWTAVLAYGTQSIAASRSRPTDYQTALRAIVSVFSCTQLLDDWHDRADDAKRGHWNAWGDEPSTLVLNAIEPLIADAARCVTELHPHPLRHALFAQLRDTSAELADLVALKSRPSERTPHGPVERGVRFLAERLGAEAPGLWRDFACDGVSVGSTECVSAIVATLLAPIPTARPIARTVVSTLLAHARTSGGWGYREDVVEDVDSTAWVILAAAMTGVTASPGLIEQSQRFLVAHCRTDGGFATYTPDERALLTIGNLPEWSESDTSVTCSTLLALATTGYHDDGIVRSACDYVARRGTAQGWPSFWWQGTAYGTWLAVLALRQIADRRYLLELGAAHSHLLSSRNSDGGWGVDDDSNPFDTSLAILTLDCLARPEDNGLLRQSSTVLAAMQGADGQWPGGARMLAPGVDEGCDVVLRDHLLTTACAVSALNAVARRE